MCACVAHSSRPSRAILLKSNHPRVLRSSRLIVGFDSGEGADASATRPAKVMRTSAGETSGARAGTFSADSAHFDDHDIPLNI